MSKRLDIVLLGATGYTGRRCIGEIYRLTKEKGRSLTWGIAGRNEAKLKSCILKFEKQTGHYLASVPILYADINNFESLKKVAASARVIINCCGPYRFFGEPVVKACLETKTHHVDVTGEPQYMEEMHFKYNEVAQERGVYVVQACGMDSIPSDLGVVYLQKKFGGTVNSVETYVKLIDKDSNVDGPTFNYATWESLVHGLANSHKLDHLRKQIKKKPLPRLIPKLQPKPMVHKVEPLNSWAVPFLGADRSVIQRTQRYLYETQDKRPTQIQTYLEVPTMLGLIKLALFGKVFTFFVKYNYGRQLLLNYPKLFSMGVFSFESPSDEKAKNTEMLLTILGKGWNETDPEDVQPTKNMTVQISGKDVLYGLTATMATLSAIVILTESDNLPKVGGVYTPGAAFENTSLLDQLQENGLSIIIKSSL